MTMGVVGVPQNDDPRHMYGTFVHNGSKGSADSASLLFLISFTCVSITVASQASQTHVRIGCLDKHSGDMRDVLSNRSSITATLPTCNAAQLQLIR